MLPEQRPRQPFSPSSPPSLSPRCTTLSVSSSSRWRPQMWGFELFSPSTSRVTKKSTFASLSKNLSYTLNPIAQPFWWHSIQENVHEFFSPCSVCAGSNVSCRAPVGLLRPYKFHVFPGPTFQWTSSQICLLQRVRWSSSLSLISFLRWSILLPCRSYPPPQIQCSQSCFMFFYGLP